MKCPRCKTKLRFRAESKRNDEILLSCNCEKDNKWQCRKGDYTHAYQVKKHSELETKSVRVQGRITPSRAREIIENFGSFQKYLDLGQVL